MLKGALEKLEHLRQDITHEFGTNLSKTWKNKFNKDNAGLWLSVDATKKKKQCMLPTEINTHCEVEHPVLQM